MNNFSPWNILRNRGSGWKLRCEGMGRDNDSFNNKIANYRSRWAKANQRSNPNHAEQERILKSFTKDYKSWLATQKARCETRREQMRNVLAAHRAGRPVGHGKPPRSPGPSPSSVKIDRIQALKAQKAAAEQARNRYIKTISNINKRIKSIESS